MKVRAKFIFKFIIVSSFSGLSEWKLRLSLRIIHLWKASKYGVISDPYFPVFSPNTGQYGPEITPYLDTFHAITVSTFCSSLPSLSCVSGTNAVSSATESAT